MGRYDAPQPNHSLWTLSVYVELQKGQQGQTDISGHPTRAAAIRRYNLTSRLLGTSWYMIVVWIVPPQEQGKPQQYYRRVQRRRPKRGRR